jgi:hypothetical protein
MSTNSDPNDSSVSLLARISKRTESNASSLATPVELKSAFPISRPAGGKLHIETNVPATKQNKSAYPSFASNGILLPAGDQTPSIQEPAPVTAGPDLGRQRNARLEIVGLSNVRPNQPSSRRTDQLTLFTSADHPQKDHGGLQYPPFLQWNRRRPRRRFSSHRPQSRLYPLNW